MNWKRKSERNWGRLVMRYRLEEIVDVTMGQSPKSEYYNTEKDGYPFLQGNRTFGFKYPTFDTYTTVVTKFAKAGDVIMSVRAPVGALNITPVDMCLGRGVCSLRMKNGNQSFLFYMMKYYVSHLLKKESGTVFGSVNRNDINGLEVDIPEDEEEQKRVAQYLEMIDDKIELNNAINNNLEQQAVLLFKQWFINFENHSEKMIETQFGMIPTSFKLMKNVELPMVVTDYVANGSFASLKANVKLYQEDNYAYFIRNTDLKSGTFEVFVDKTSYDFLSKSTLYGGEIIISNVGDVGSVFLCPKLSKPMTLGNNIIMIRPEQKNLQYYLFIWFKWLYGQSLIQGIKGGSAQPKFNKTDFRNLLIYLPNDNLLEKFHQTVEPMFELIDENNSENQSLVAIRDSLLPKLISGEINVSSIDL